MAMVISNALYLKRAVDSAGNPVASQSLTVSTAAVSATGYTAVPAVDGVFAVSLDVQTSNVRVRFDGVSPTSTVGHILYAGGNYTWDAARYNAAKFIRDSSASVDATIFASAESN